jgi:hypothetical protein
MEQAVMEHRDWDNGSETGNRDFGSGEGGIMKCAGLSGVKACHYSPLLVVCSGQ